MPWTEINIHFVAILKKYIIKRRKPETYSGIL